MLKEIWILRLSHRIVRDARVTTHVALVGRAFGAKGMYYTGDRDKELEEKIRSVVDSWGGDFKVIYVESPLKLVRSWKEKGGVVIHLTMYGINIDDKINEIRNMDRDMLVIVGSEKVPRIYYEISDYNIAIGHQPHSEVAALAIFLDRIYMGRELKLKFKNAKIEIVPKEKGKMVRKLVN